jgi:hypothetical protein
MSAGTLTLTNNSASVGGTGTTFTTDLTAGDFIVVTVGGVPYTLPVKAVNNNTALTLVSNYSGPTQAGAAWSAVPRAALNMVTAALVVQGTEALRGLNFDKANWQAVFSASGDITVLLPDGSSFTGPSWKSIQDILISIDIDVVQQLADQVRGDALQVATDKDAAHSDAVTARADAQAAESANSSAQDAKAAAETAAGTATDKAAEAEGHADAAGTARAAAELAAATVQPENLLQNMNNLSDLTDKPAARSHLEVLSRTEIADLLPGYLGQVDWQEMRGALEPGTAPRDGQEVDQSGIFADLYARAVAGKLPTCTEAEWQADPLKRGCYVPESSPGKMRLPDDNGVQPGSLRIPVKVGDAGDISLAGAMADSALPNIKGTLLGSAARGVYKDDVSEISGPIQKLQQYTGNGIVPQSTASAANERYQIGFNATLASDVYQDGVTEIQPNRQYGCWTVRFATRATNGGSIDALTLATAIAEGDQINANAIIATNERIDYALLDFGTMALSQRKVLANPFGNNQPVEVIAEILRTDLTGQARWGDSGWIYSAGGYGTKGSYMEGEGIVVQCGNNSMGNTSTQTGTPHQITATTAVNNVPVRVHVRKITA